MSDLNPKSLFKRTEAYSILSNQYSKRSMQIKRRHFWRLSFKFPIISESVLRKSSRPLRVRQVYSSCHRRRISTSWGETLCKKSHFGYSRSFRPFCRYEKMNFEILKFTKLLIKFFSGLTPLRFFMEEIEWSKGYLLRYRKVCTPSMEK